jgi:alkylation response protein AidB-like acyl-CoA dehydrogenase
VRPTAIDTPFFDAAHRELAQALDAFASRNAAPSPNVDEACRRWVRALGDAGFLRHCVPAAYGGATAHVDSRSLCVAREVLAYHDGLADFAFAMQGLGTGAITLAGSEDQRERWLPAGRARRGHRRVRAVGAGAGSDAGGARDDGPASRRRLGARRREDVDQQRRDRRRLLRVRAHRGGARREGHLGVRRARGRAGARSPSGTT